MKIIEAKNLLNELKIKFSENLDLQNALSLGVEALEKQIPRKPKIEKWSPAYCPSCDRELSESVGDGYYEHYDQINICECGQKLKWT